MKNKIRQYVLNKLNIVLDIKILNVYIGYIQ